MCVLTNMDEPLGYAVGNNLEVIEAINFLKGIMPEDLKQVVLELGAYMVKLAGKGENIEENKRILLENIQNKKAYNKFLELVKNQDGDISYLEQTEKFSKAKFIEPVYSETKGYIQKIDAEKVGRLSCYLGAGRINKEDNIDDTVGIILSKKVSDYVEIGDIICYVHANDEIKMKEVKEKLQEIIVINEEKVQKPCTILEIIKNH